MLIELLRRLTGRRGVEEWDVLALWDTEGYHVGHKVVQRRRDGEEVPLKVFRLAGDVKIALSSGGKAEIVFADSGEVVLDGYYARKLGGAVGAACAREAEDWAQLYLGPKPPPPDEVGHNGERR